MEPEWSLGGGLGPGPGGGAETGAATLDPGPWLAELAGLVLSGDIAGEVLGSIVAIVLRSVAGVDGASVTLAGSEAHHLGNTASDSAVRALDEAQQRGEDGPCVLALRSGEEVWWSTEDSRWPDLASRFAQSGYTRVGAIPLRVGEHVHGGLNLYGKGEALGADALQTARAVAHFGAVVLHNAAALMSAELTNRHLQTALEHRDVIGQAKGILMARRAVTADEAFDLLRRASQHNGRKLRDVAAGVVARYGPPGLG